MKRVVSVVIPVFRNEKAITKTVGLIRDEHARALPDYDLELVCVDDGSDDGSLAELLELRKADPRVKVITFTRNFGQVSAMLAGFREATGAAVVNISADLQDPVELIPQMVKQWEAGAELVVCHRTDRDDGWRAKLVSKAAYGLIRLSIPRIPSGGFDYVLMDRILCDNFGKLDARNRFFQGDLLWFGYKTSFIPYVRQKREIGRSQWHLGKRVKYFLDAILDASYLPIRMCTLLGFVTAALGVLWAAVIVWAWWAGQTPWKGYAPIMMAALLIGGVQMIMLGIVGEYVWRIYDEVRHKPNYVIRASYK